MSGTPWRPMAATCVALVASSVSLAQSFEYDVVVYGGTSGGVAAAVQAARMGKTVALIDPGCYVGDGTYVSHLGGLSSGGLGRSDVGGEIGGIAADFYRREDLLGGGSGTNVHAGKAEQVFDAMVSESGVDVFRLEHLDRAGGVAKTGATITSIAMTSGKTFGAKCFVDGTYEGDLMAAAGVSYTVGREARSVHGETYNGIAYDRTREHVFGGTRVDPYVVAGDPGSGLLPGVHLAAQDPRGNGAADERIQAYCYRMTWTKSADRTRWTDLWGANGENPPDGYDRATYELHDRFVQARGGGLSNYLRTGTGIGGGKTDINNWGPCSTDFIGGNYGVFVPATGRTTNYAEATDAEREYITQKHIEYQKGLLYYLAFDCSRASIRSEMAAWGLAADEFTDNGNFPHQLYVREARRMVGEYTMTEHNCTGSVSAPKPIGMGGYPMDSHNTHRYVRANGSVESEGNFWLGGLTKTYSVDYGTITPQQDEADNLLSVCALSGTHTAFGSMRMEPVFLVLGQSGGAAAVQAIEEDTPVQQITFADYQALLRAYGQKLTTSEPGDPPFVGTMREDFNYGPTGNNLSTVSYTAPGWAGRWSADGADPQYDPTSDLIYGDGLYENASSVGVSGGAADATGMRSGHIATRHVRGGASGTIWLSWLASMDDATGQEALVWLDGHAMGLADGGVLELSGQTGGTSLADGEVHLLLAKLLVGAGDDSIRLWIDPDLSAGEDSLGVSSLIVDGTDLFGDSLDQLGISVGPDGGRLDAIRLSNTDEAFAQVTGVPEPAALTLWGLWIVAARKRRGRG